MVHSKYLGVPLWSQPEGWSGFWSNERFPQMGGSFFQAIFKGHFCGSKFEVTWKNLVYIMYKTRFWWKKENFLIFPAVVSPSPKNCESSWKKNPTLRHSDSQVVGQNPVFARQILGEASNLETKKIVLFLKAGVTTCGRVLSFWEGLFPGPKMSVSGRVTVNIRKIIRTWSTKI